MPPSQPPAQAQWLLQLLATRGALSSAEIQAALRLSQPSVSRLLALVDDEVVVCGQGKSTRYALAQPVGTHAAQQPIWMLDEQGVPSRIGTLSLLARGQMHIGAQGISEVFESTPQQPLPWYLSPLRAQGFLGRVLAQRLAAQGLAPNPDQWDTEAVLLAALHTPDAPGALWLGGAVDGPVPDGEPVLPLHDPGPVLDGLARDVVKTLPWGSSAGGEQPKFTATDEAGTAWLVKFSAPAGTPFGDRWTDLLLAEALCSQVLARHGHDCAETHTVRTSERTYLLSRRFDRVAARGRRHLVSLGAAHAGFAKSRYVNWPATADALASQRRLGAADAARLHDLFEFGRLTGNTDMHAGNASLWVAGHSLREMVQGRFALAPVYDMLPMRWKPDPMWGLPDFAPFEVDLSRATLPVRQAARDFWQSLAGHADISAALRAVAEVMATRMG